MQLVENMEAKDLNSVRWYIDCGDDDFLYKSNSLMHIKMREKMSNMNSEFETVVIVGVIEGFTTQGP